MPVLQKGDILVFHDINGVSIGSGAAQVLKMVTILPAVYSACKNSAQDKDWTSAFTSIASAGAVHCAVVVEVMSGDYWISHATTAGLISGKLSKVRAGYGGEITAYRMEKGFYGDVVAKVAETWATDITSQTKLSDIKNTHFANKKAGFSAFGNSAYGSGAKERAALYAQYKSRPGGPPHLVDNGSGTKKFFCSMFAIACTQAGLTEGERKMFMSLDAKYSSPMVLEDYLKSHPRWEAIAPIT